MLVSSYTLTKGIFIMIKKITDNWSLETYYNDETDYTQVFINHTSGESASVACAENEGELWNGVKVPARILSKAVELEDSLN